MKLFVCAKYLGLVGPHITTIYGQMFKMINLMHSDNRYHTATSHVGLCSREFL